MYVGKRKQMEIEQTSVLGEALLEQGHTFADEGVAFFAHTKMAYRLEPGSEDRYDGDQYRAKVSESQGSKYRGKNRKAA